MNKEKINIPVESEDKIEGDDIALNIVKQGMTRRQAIENERKYRDPIRDNVPLQEVMGIDGYYREKKDKEARAHEPNVIEKNNPNSNKIKKWSKRVGATLASGGLLMGAAGLIDHYKEPSPIGYETHVVEDNDTISGIAEEIRREHGLSSNHPVMDEIARANKDTIGPNDIINPGDVLTVPDYETNNDK